MAEATTPSPWYACMPLSAWSFWGGGGGGGYFQRNRDNIRSHRRQRKFFVPRWPYGRGKHRKAYIEWLLLIEDAQVGERADAFAISGSSFQAEMRVDFLKAALNNKAGKKLKDAKTYVTCHSIFGIPSSPPSGNVASRGSTPNRSLKCCSRGRVCAPDAMASAPTWTAPPLATASLLLASRDWLVQETYTMSAIMHAAIITILLMP